MIVAIEEIYEDEQPVSWIADTDKVNHIFREAVLKEASGEDAGEIPYNAGFQIEHYNPEAQVFPPCAIEASVTIYCTSNNFELADELEEIEFQYRDKFE